MVLVETVVESALGGEVFLGVLDHALESLVAFLQTHMGVEVGGTERVGELGVAEEFVGAGGVVAVMLGEGQGGGLVGQVLGAGGA